MAAKQQPTASAPVPFHTLESPDVVAALGSDAKRGLSHTEAAARLSQHGPNLIAERSGPGMLYAIAAQFTDLMILILIAAAVISAFIGEITDAIVIVAIVILNGAIGATQEYRAERALAALQKLAPARATVLRSGRHHELSAREIVPGDMVVLEAGGHVPADLRLTETHQVRISEAALTGESVPVEKDAGALASPDLSLGDRRNMAYKGTTVTYGRGLGVAVATGMRTELGGVAALIGARTATQTPLQQRLTQFGRVLALIVIAICAVIFVAGIARGEPPLLMFLTAISLAVAAIPEALPATVTIALAAGARTMAGRNALVRRLSAVETLGSVTYICSDKTGTLTRNEMAVEAVVTAAGSVGSAGFATDGEPWQSLFLAAALNNDADLKDGRAVGDPTETALLMAAIQRGLDLDELRERMPREAEIAFDSNRKRMTTIHPTDDGYIGYTKGAPEIVIERCTGLRTKTGVAPIRAGDWLAAAERLAADGLRVLAIAERRWPARPATEDSDAVESKAVLLGLVGMIDPPRAEAIDAVAACRSAGIAPVMITGDHPATARAIGRRLGIIDGGEVVTGRELARMDDDALAAGVESIRVYARVDPAQKIRVVKALQKRGEFVAMTGDGVNDAPALRKADIGVAMGKTGTDVAREVSDLVLIDDNFATIVVAVREGRRIYDNLRRVIKYVMTGNCAELATIFLAPFLGMPIPLLPIQILWINLLSDGLPALALTVEPEEPDVMQRPPRAPKESAFAGGVWQHIVFVGLLTAGIALAVQAYGIGNGMAGWQTMVFTVLALGQSGLALALRSDRQSIFRRGLFTNPAMLGSVGLAVGLQVAIIYVPALHPIFNTTPLAPSELAVCAAGMVGIVALAEIWKWFARLPAPPHLPLTSGSALSKI